MITNIKIYRYDVLVNLYRPPTDVYISVTEIGMQNQIAPTKESNILPLQFFDCGGMDGTSGDQGKFRGPGLKVYSKCSSFTNELAKEIIEFLDANRNLPGEQTLHVNCMAGKSRSGAIGTFAAWYLGLNLEEFKNTNNWIVPNLHVLTTLINNV